MSHMQDGGRAGLARRIREIRLRLYGEHGAPMLAEALGLPARTWFNFEAGVVMPDITMLRFIDISGANPRWLLSGDGEPWQPLPDRLPALATG